MKKEKLRKIEAFLLKVENQIATAQIFFINNEIGPSELLDQLEDIQYTVEGLRQHYGHE